MKLFNFCSGPATLPKEVLQEASRGILDIESGLSVLEISHRGKIYEKIHTQTRLLLLKLLGLSPAEYEVLLCGGGASLQFAMVPMNFLRGQEASADYIHTGEWSKKAMAEARRFGTIKIAGANAEPGFLPTQYEWDKKARYVHITTNNTIEGTEFQTLPQGIEAPLIGDLSSNILGRAYDYSRFSLIYAGAQKNLGAAGVTFVVIRKSFLQKAWEDVPTLLSYKELSRADALYNTPPVYAVYISLLTLRWIDKQGGVRMLEQKNIQKAKILYDALELYQNVYELCVPRAEHRSIMNVTFRTRLPQWEEEFLKLAESHFGLVGLAGHRSFGGFRASIYNAMPMEGVLKLVDCLGHFAKSR